MCNESTSICIETTVNRAKIWNFPSSVELESCQDENPQRVNEMDSASFEGFHSQLDCKFTYSNKNQTQLALFESNSASCG